MTYQLPPHPDFNSNEQRRLKTERDREWQKAHSSEWRSYKRAYNKAARILGTSSVKSTRHKKVETEEQVLRRQHRMREAKRAQRARERGEVYVPIPFAQGLTGNEKWKELERQELAWLRKRGMLKE